MPAQRNKVAWVKTIDVVAAELGEDIDQLSDIANEMEPEDGLIWVYGLAEHGVMAFSDDGIDALQELVAIHRRPST